MKKLVMLMLASGMLSVTARADVGKDKSAPDCKQVIQSIQEQLKKNRPVAADAPVPGSDGVPSGAGTAK